MGNNKEYIEKRKKELTEQFNKVKENILKIEKEHATLIDEVKRLQGAYAEVIAAEKGIGLDVAKEEKNEKK